MVLRNHHHLHLHFQRLCFQAPALETQSSLQWCLALKALAASLCDTRIYRVRFNLQGVFYFVIARSLNTPLILRMQRPTAAFSVVVSRFDLWYSNSLAFSRFRRSPSGVDPAGLLGRIEFGEGRLICPCLKVAHGTV